MEQLVLHRFRGRQELLEKGEHIVAGQGVRGAAEVFDGVADGAHVARRISHVARLHGVHSPADEVTKRFEVFRLLLRQVQLLEVDLAGQAVHHGELAVLLVRINVVRDQAEVVAQRLAFLAQKILLPGRKHRQRSLGDGQMGFTPAVGGQEGEQGRKED